MTNQNHLALENSDVARKLRLLLANLQNFELQDLRSMLLMLQLLEPKSDKQFLLDSIRAKIDSCNNIGQFVDMAEMVVYRNKATRWAAYE